MTQGVEKQIGAFPAVEAESHFVEVGLQMLCANFMPRSDDAALEQRERRFNSIAVRTVWFCVLPSRMVRHSMPCKLLGDRTLPVNHCAISHQVRFARFIVRENPTNVLCCHVYWNK